MAFFQDWARDMISVITDPIGFFRKMKTDGGYREPLMFIVFNGVIGCILNIIQRNYFPIEMFEEVYENSFLFKNGEAAYVMYAIAIGVVSIYIFSGIEHLVLRMLGAKKDFEATFRVNAYITAYNPIIAILYLFGPIGMFIGMVLAFAINFVKAIGYREAHKISYLRALVAALIIPIVVFVLLLITILIVIIFAVAITNAQA